MFYILISAVFILPVLAGFGSLFEKLFGSFFSAISSKLFSGTVFLTVFWTVLAFFIPLNIYVEVFSLGVGFFCFFYFKNYLDFYKIFSKNKILLPLIILTTLFFSSFYPYILDHFGYYVPTIKWISEFGLVKGIANLDLILGQMSFWHVFQAGFSNFSDPFLRLNATLLIIYIIYIFEKKSWLHLTFLPILFLFSQQPSPDLPVFVFSLIILNELLKGNQNETQILAFSVFVFAVKPTAIWLPILAFLYSLFILKFNFKKLIPTVLVLLLFVFKNVWCFGFPVFPMTFLDFGIPWKPNSELMQNSAQLAIEKTYDMQFSYAEIQKFTVWEHIKNWFFLKGIKGKIHFLFIFSLLIFSIFTLLKKQKVITLIFISILIKSILVLLFSAQYRFFLDVFFVIAFVILYQHFSKKTSLFVFGAATIVLGAILVVPKVIQTHLPSFNLGFAMNGIQKKQWYQPANYQYKKFKTYKIGNLNFNVVKDYPFTFDTPLPAISPSYILEDYNAGIFPQKKSDTLKDGFHWRKMNDEEKLQVKKILLELKIDEKLLKD